MNRLALVLPLLLVTACGGATKGDLASTKQAYLLGAEAVCTQASTTQQAIVPPASNAQFASYITQTLGVAQKEVNGLLALSPPASDRAQLQSKVLAPLQQQLREGQKFLADLNRAIRHNDQVTVRQLVKKAPGRAPVDLTFMRDYGFVACVEALKATA